ncbi:MAG TPA: ATP synthase F1 subunit delta [Gemmatimonadales bacterium]|nr:ATP synthase F1 subunit delta [Gemmatimonadales bacterium]
MREPTIARNYAGALFAAAERTGDTVRFADLLESVAGAISADERIRLVLASPRTAKEQKRALLRQALTGRAPEPFLRFLDAVIRRGRQDILGAISREYAALVDVKLNRVHAGVTLAREPDRALVADIQRRLSELTGKEVVPHVRTDPRILGGVIVRIGDRIMDGSVRRRMLALRRHMLGG